MCISKLLKDERGASAIEYSLVAMLIGVAALGSFMSLGDSVKQRFDTIELALTTAI